ncbi:MAG: hypothetical protein KAT28_02015 [Candidatus Aenigmarchaeota archaeon]|nr:hypothetical protein [Candidatus Aenigmarchaeota archaeon]
MNRKLILLILVLAITPVNAAEVTTFVNPDCSYESLENFLSDYSSLYIAVYEFTNPCIADLIEKKDNTEIILLVENVPVSGMKLAEKKILCGLKENNIRVVLYDGEGFHHAKYIIKDNSSVLIASENFGYTGFSRNPSFGNRGWGAVVEDDKTANDFLKTFFGDLKISEEFVCELDDYKTACNPEVGYYSPGIEPERFRNQEVYSIFAPNAIDDILELIESADTSIYIQQMYIYKYWGSKKDGSVDETPSLFLEKVINKSREGVDVKILLDSYWYNIDRKNPVSNYHTVEYVNQIAEEENLNLEARLINLDKTNLEKIHNKGVIIDNTTVLVSSINWNKHSPKKNREAGIVIKGDSAKYYAKVFFCDWKGEIPCVENIPGEIIKTDTNQNPLIAFFMNLISWIMSLFK